MLVIKPIAGHSYLLKLIKRLFLARTKDKIFFKNISPSKLLKKKYLQNDKIPECISPRTQNQIT
jgi:hypothetical protein